MHQLPLRTGPLAPTKAEQVRDALRAGDNLSALRIAARFHDASRETAAFRTGWEAHRNPGLYRQMGRDPEALVAAAVAALVAKFGA